jgi:predicted DNA-binding transcriptional regulator AlpA
MSVLNGHGDATSLHEVSAALRALADRADSLELAELCGALEALKVRVWTAALAPKGAPPRAAAAEADRLLTIDEASERLGVTRDWVRRRSRLPFVVKLSEGVVRYSASGIACFIAQHCPPQA